MKQKEYNKLQTKLQDCYDILLNSNLENKQSKLDVIRNLQNDLFNKKETLLK